jgi:stage II sporulation protein D
VGSLQKPFVAKAWAEAFPERPTPRLRCGPASGCWRPSGHGGLGLARALAVSCNAYFRALAAEVPPDLLARAFAAEGFLGAPGTPDAALGLEGEAGGPAIAPQALLRAYCRLVEEPWLRGEAVRQEVLRGLGEAARTGTAQGLGRRAAWAKTGTVPSDGPGPTAGFAWAADAAGGAALARLEPGTGREAAAALAPLLDRARPWPAPPAAGPGAPAPRAGGVSPGEVRVRLVDLLGVPRLEVRNLGAAPVSFGRGFLGPGAVGPLEPGAVAGPGLLELRAPALGFLRRIQGRVACPQGLRGARRVVATLSAREYVSGVLAAELPTGPPARRAALGAAVLRFLARGPRHGAEADVCDSTHCAWFVGRGPRLQWLTPRRAVETGAGLPVLDEGPWQDILALSREPGPDLWSAHCGGAPLAERAVWDRGAAEAWPCLRHAGAPEPRPWARTWPDADLAKAFGGPVSALAVAWPGGAWRLEVTTPGGLRRWSYDAAHRRLAAVLGWDALPSPAARVEAGPDGWRALGTGWGHRVGLCLAD